MLWAEIEIEAVGDDQEAAGALLMEVAGCHGYASSDTGVVGYLPIDDRLEGALLRLREALGRTLTIRRRVAEEDWAHAWKQYFKPQRIGRRLVVKPSWEEFAAQPEDLILEMDPGMAFGTGLHATTRLCLRALEEIVTPGARVADVGTGSGILAVAAIRLGAARVEATDNDPLAVDIARQNAARNGVDDRITVAEATQPPTGPFDIVVANILPDVILGMADSLVAATRPGGTLIVSGIIEPRADEVRAGLTERGLSVLESPIEGEWVAIVAQRG